MEDPVKSVTQAMYKRPSKQTNVLSRGCMIYLGLGRNGYGKNKGRCWCMLGFNTGGETGKGKKRKETEGDRLICSIAMLVANTGWRHSEGDRLIREVQVHAIQKNSWALQAV